MVFFLAIILVSLLLFSVQRRIQRSRGTTAPAATAEVTT
jgi:hypothetical protein